MPGWLFGKKLEFSSSEIRRIVGKAAVSTAAASPTAFIVGTDLPVVAPILADMIFKIANAHDLKMDLKGATKFVTVVLGAASSWLGISGVVSKVIAVVGAVTGVGIPLGIGINAIANACFTCRVGAVFDALCSDENGCRTIQELGRLAIRKICPLPTWGEIKDCIALIRELKS